MTARSGVHVALLRGINVGGNNLLPMKDLAALFAAEGCAAVRTYIQSGNVIYEAAPALAGRVAAAIQTAILKQFGHRVPVVIRTAAELEGVVRGNPFLRGGAAGDTEGLHVAFLSETPTPARVGALDTSRSPPDEFVVRGRDIYLRFPNGVGRTKLSNAYFESKLATTSTLRNWRTVCKLVELSAG